MKNETLIALKDSIEHWKRLESGTQGVCESLTSADCALCLIFNNSDNPKMDCEGCPVANKSGYAQCNNTPYYNARDLWKTPQFPAAARKMREFLENLLPKE
jgi:hypothetical protein